MHRKSRKRQARTGCTCNERTSATACYGCTNSLGRVPTSSPPILASRTRADLQRSSRATSALPLIPPPMQHLQMEQRRDSTAMLQSLRAPAKTPTRSTVHAAGARRTCSDTDVVASTPGQVKASVSCSSLPQDIFSRPPSRDLDIARAGGNGKSGLTCASRLGQPLKTASNRVQL
ncbi:hypothetical protein EXIGLDRAFT_326046 [Exidia glandulosa HHB12029]|uniref:Uncharacterized protein n=1 Tax=Exidia glandulosa HHB12029 TaxID=1314781 RepID=A0A165CTX9_EXIGL|nr:hypothetical protein EXIGLDRAFT_326046 [Exidia glandulosa HHB12029]